MAHYKNEFDFPHNQVGCIRQSNKLALRDEKQSIEC